jgi:Tfp pilus assembly protein PilF
MSGKTRKQQIEEMLAEDPQDSFLRYGLAMEYASDKDDEGAVRCFQELLNVDPFYVPAFLQFSQALMRLHRFDEARVILNRGIAAARQQGDVHAAEEMHGFLAGLGPSRDS